MTDTDDPKSPFYVLPPMPLPANRRRPAVIGMSPARLKRNPSKTKGRFQFLRRFWFCPATADLGHAEQAAWLYLWFLADSRGRCHPSLNRIGMRMGCSRVYAKKVIAGLRRKGYLAIVERGSNCGVNWANTYRLRLPQGDSDG